MQNTRETEKTHSDIDRHYGSTKKGKDSIDLTMTDSTGRMKTTDEREMIFEREAVRESRRS